MDMTPLTPEPPAEGVARTLTLPDSHSYHIMCTCGHPDHAIDTWVEVDQDLDLGNVEVSFYVKTYTAPIYGFMDRAKSALRLLYTGEISQEHTLILSKQAALNFSGALVKSVTLLSGGRKNGL